MSITTHQRPGVYSAYDASALVYGRGRGGLVGLAAVNTAVEAGTLTTVTSYEKAVSVFGIEGDMAILAGLALRNGASGVVCAAVADADGYEDAFALLCSREDIPVMICDSTSLMVQQMLRDSANAASASRRERIAVVGTTKGEKVDTMLTRAAGLNSERVVLVAPGAVNGEGAAISGNRVAACVAGVLASEPDPAIPLGGAALQGLSGLSQHYSDNELDQLILGGVTPVEELGGTVSVVRGVTTRTMTDGSYDSTWRDLCTIRVIDAVIPALRASLRSKFRRAKNTPRGRGAIRTQVVLELENFLSREIITAYDDVTVTADETDPTRALVDFNFTVAHGLNQIWLSAHITV